MSEQNGSHGQLTSAIAALDLSLQPSDPLHSRFEANGHGASVAEPPETTTQAEEVQEAIAHQTQVPLSKRGTTKFLLVGGVGLLFVLGAGVMFQPKEKPIVATQNSPSPSSSPSPSPALGNPNDIEQGKLKTALAMQTQANWFASRPSPGVQQPNVQQPNGQQPGQQPNGQQIGGQQLAGQPSGQQPGGQQAGGIAHQMGSPSQPGAAQQASPQSPPVQSAQVVSPPSGPAEPPLDPQVELKRLAIAGSYGSMPPIVAALPVSMPVVAPVAAAPSPGAVTTSTPVSPTIPSLTSYVPPDAPLATKRTIVLGTRAKATLGTPVVWAGNGNRAGLGGVTPKYLVMLEEPLLDNDGLVALPKGTQIVVTVRPIEAGTGMAELDSAQVIINGKEYRPPDGTITVRGPEGGPLIAGKFRDRGQEIASMDLGLFFISALGKAGEIINRPQSQTVSNGVGFSSVQTQNPQPDVVAAFLQGGFETLSQQLAKRNQEAIKEILAQPDVWMLNQGQSVQVFVNQSVTL